MSTETDYDDKPINPVTNAVIATVIAVILVSLGAFAYVYLGRPQPVASLAITRVSAAPMPIERQTEEGTDIPVTIADQYLAFVNLHIQNLSDKPLQIEEINADLLENGNTVADPKNPDVTTTTIKRSIAASLRDYNRLFELYPQFAAYKGSPIQDEVVIPAHQSLEGTVVFSFGVDQKEWDLRKGLAVHVSFENNTRVTAQAP